MKRRNEGILTGGIVYSVMMEPAFMRMMRWARAARSLSWVTRTRAVP